MSDFSRHEKLVGEKGIKRLSEANLAVFGIGGVGGYVAEALARAAIGSIVLVDSDEIEPSNINRQIIALESTLGIQKVEVMKKRILDINPNCNVLAIKAVITENNIESLLNGITYAVDAVDDVKAKTEIIKKCKSKGIPVISAMGAGNRIHGTFRVMDIYETKDDALAKIMRKELKKRGIEKLKVVCCDAKASINHISGQPVQSISYMPGLCGLTITGEVIRDIIGDKDD